MIDLLECKTWEEFKAKRREIEIAWFEKHPEHKSKDVKGGIRNGRQTARNKSWALWNPYKKIIAPESILHHEWIPETAEFRGLALVDTMKHDEGIIDVIQILEGEITLFEDRVLGWGHGK